MRNSRPGRASPTVASETPVGIYPRCGRDCGPPLRRRRSGAPSVSSLRSRAKRRHPEGPSPASQRDALAGSWAEPIQRATSGIGKPKPRIPAGYGALVLSTTARARSRRDLRRTEPLLRSLGPGVARKTSARVADLHHEKSPSTSARSGSIRSSLSMPRWR